MGWGSKQHTDLYWGIQHRTWATVDRMVSTRCRMEPRRATCRMDRSGNGVMATYYVDATNGDDGDTGLSAELAWQTLARVNTEVLVPDDFVLLKRGEVWTGEQLAIAESGTAGHSITFGVYGTGVNPIIDGDHTVTCVYASGRSYLDFNNIDCRHGLSSGFQFYTGCHHINLVDCNAYHAGNDGVIFIDGCHDCTVTGGEFYDQHTGGVAAKSGIEISDGCYNITISDVQCYDNEDVGLLIQCHDSGTYCHDITVTNAGLYGNGLYGIDIAKGDAAADAGWNVTLTDVDSYDNGVVGIGVSKRGAFTEYISGVDLIRCGVWGNGTYGFQLVGDDIYLERPVSNGDRNLLEDCHDLVMYNATFYYTAALGFYLLWVSGARTDGITMRNTIMYCGNQANYPIGIAAVATTNIDIDWTLYRHTNIALARWNWSGNFYSHANWLINSGQDANSPTPADPLFANAVLDDFTLKNGSPALEVGIDVGLYYDGTAPNCGAYGVRSIPNASAAKFKQKLGSPDLAVKLTNGEFMNPVQVRAATDAQLTVASVTDSQLTWLREVY